jgi:hypothetical protein
MKKIKPQKHISLGFNMIIELILKINDSKTLISSWEVQEKIWNEKEQPIIFFIKNVMKTEEISFTIKKENNIITHIISGKPHFFYSIQKKLEEYFKTIGIVQLIS